MCIYVPLYFCSHFVWVPDSQPALPSLMWIPPGPPHDGLRLGNQCEGWSPLKNKKIVYVYVYTQALVWAEAIGNNSYSISKRDNSKGN